MKICPVLTTANTEPIINKFTIMAKFEIFKRTDEQFHFNLKADNGKVILTSEGYTAKAGAQNGIEAVKKNAADKAMYQVIESKDGQYYFNLKSPNGQVIGTSEMYVTFDNMNEGVARVEKLAPDAEVVDLTV